MQLLSLIPTLILLLYLLVSIDLVYTGFCESTSQKKNSCILNFIQKSLKYASQNNSNEEELKKKLMNLTKMEYFKNVFSFFIGTNFNKLTTYKQFRCTFEDKMNKQIDYYGFLKICD